MSVTAKQVQELRERTGAGLMECKKALTHVAGTGGGIEEAIELMRKAGQTKADKKAGRIAAEGVVLIKINGNTGVILEINCETDFVARDEQFKHFAETALETALQAKAPDISALSALPMRDNPAQTVEEARQALIAKIGENIKLRRLVLSESKGHMASYIHGGRIGVLVEYTGGDEQLGKDLAMHIAANGPLVVNRNEVPTDIVNKEKEIFSAQAQESGKPAAIIEKMIEGRINKFLDEVSLLGQPFVKNPDITVAKLVEGANANVLGFVRFAVGEGIEKQSEDFVEAVMAQVRGN
jgi:elongation factor Ts